MQRFLRAYLSFVFIGYALIIIHFVLNDPIWSPIDEIAHYDYIDQLSSGVFPSPTSPISDFTADITIHYFEWIKSAGFNGTRETMGPAGYSYEAQQPPVYYLLLALPNLLLKLALVDPRVQIQVLRLITVAFEIFGSVAGGLVVYRLRNFLRFSPLWAWLVAVILLIPNWSWRGAIGNGNLSLLVVNLAFFFAIDNLTQPSPKASSTLAVLFGSLAVLIKYTNVLALGVVLLILLIREIYQSHRSKQPHFFRNIFTWLWPVMIVPVYLLFNILRFGLDDPLGSQAVAGLFAENPIQVWGLAFFEQFLRTSFQVSFISTALPVVPVILSGVFATTAAALYAIYKRDRINGLAWLFIVASAFSAAVFAWTMTKLAPTVDWGFFRHFSGYMLLIDLACLGAAMRTGKTEGVALVLLSAAAVIPAVYYLL